MPIRMSGVFLRGYIGIRINRKDMDITLRLRLELDEIRTDHLRRLPGESREDLLARLQVARQEASEVKIPEFAQVALLRSADILLDKARPAEALAAVKEAKAIHTGRDLGARGIDLLTCEVRAYELLERWSEASETCAEGIEIVEKARSKVTPNGLQSAYMRFKIELYEIGVRAAFEMGDYSEALRRAELAKCATARRIQRRAVDDKESIVDQREEYRTICAQLDRDDLTAAARSQLESKRRALWDYIAIRRFRDDSNSTDFIEVSHTQLARDEVLIYYFWTNELELMIFGLTDVGIVAELQVLSVDDRALIERIPQAILNYHPARGKLITPTRRHGLLLLPPAIVEVLDSRHRCLISPHRVLHLLPFHALPLEDRYLIDRHPVTYVPNLHAAVARHEPIPVSGVCAIGVPTTQVLDDSGEPIPDIPNAQAEVEEITEAYSARGKMSKKLLAQDATGGRLRALDSSGELGRFSHLHLVCHGATVDSDSPLESKLVLSDAILDGLDISEFELNAEVTVLSACCSGQRPFQMPALGETSIRVELPGDELFGLQAAFFTAGSHQLVASLWPVDSEPALKISIALHEYLLAGLPADEALQQSMINYRENAGLFFRKVDKWAPFFLASLSRPTASSQ